MESLLPEITFMGAGSAVFARNVLGDCMCTPALCESEIALYDIDAERLEESYIILSAINHNTNQDRAALKTYCGVENRREALRAPGFRQRDPGRLLRALHRHRLRDPEEVRPAPDDRRHARHRRRHARPAHDTGARGLRPRHRGGLPRRVVPQLHEPDGDALRLYAALHECEDRRPLPQRADLLARPAEGPRHGG